MKPTHNLSAIPLPQKPDPVTVGAYAMLVGELMYIAVNTRPTIAYSVHDLARYMTTATPQHMSDAKQPLRYVVGLAYKGRKLIWRAARARPPYVAGRIHLFADSS